MKYYKLFGAAGAVGLLLFLGFGCGGGGGVSDEEEEYIQEQIAPLEENISSLNTEIASLREDITSAKEEVALLKTKMENLASEEEMAKVQEEVGSLRKDIASLREEVALLKTRAEEISFPPAVEKMKTGEEEKISEPFKRMAPAPTDMAPQMMKDVKELQAELTEVAYMLPSLQVQVEETSALDRLRLIQGISQGDLTSYMLYSIAEGK
jgi:chromosome segregation ATPase